MRYLIQWFGMIFIFLKPDNDVVIYGIRKLNTKRYVYVGQTVRHLEERWARHIQDAAKKKHVNKDLEKFLNANRGFIVLDVLEFTNTNRKTIREKYWINRLKHEGHNLLNKA